MSEEEKKAIEKVKSYIKDFNDDSLDKRDFKTVLNLIEKQDKMIDLILDEKAYIPENEIYKVEKIYEEVKDKTELKGIELKRYCIKEYFRKKVENEN